MMQQLLKSVFVAAFYIALSFNYAMAAEKGSASDATALVKKAGEFLKANGKDKAFSEFSNPKGQFIDRDLYIFALNSEGKMLAHGTNSRLIDKNLSDLKDADGKLIIKEFIQVGDAKGKGWVDYKWPNPVSKAIEPKSTYIEKVGDVMIGCGIYK